MDPSITYGVRGPVFLHQVLLNYSLLLRKLLWEGHFRVRCQFFSHSGPGLATTLQQLFQQIVAAARFRH